VGFGFAVRGSGFWRVASVVVVLFLSAVGCEVVGLGVLSGAASGGLVARVRYGSG
jgi:hypothetical protein